MEMDTSSHTPSGHVSHNNEFAGLPYGQGGSSLYPSTYHYMPKACGQILQPW